MSDKLKTKNKKINKKQTTKKKNETKQVDKFSFNEEIVIGLKKAPDQDIKKGKKRKKKNTKTEKAKQEKIRKEREKSKKRREKPPSKFKIFMSKAAKYIIILIILLVIAIFFVLSPLFNITEIAVKGNEKISSEYIVNLSEIPLDTNTFKINKKDIIKRLKQEPYIESIVIKRNLPSVIEIEIVERQATYMLEFANAFVYINNQGYMLEVSEEKLELPIIIGYKTPTEEMAPGNRLITEDLHNLEIVLKVMEAAKSNEIAGYITKIDISSGLNIKLILEGEGKIAYLGDCTSINTRMQHLKVIIEKEAGKNGEAFINGDMKNDSSSTFREAVS